MHESDDPRGKEAGDERLLVSDSLSETHPIAPNRAQLLVTNGALVPPGGGSGVELQVVTAVGHGNCSICVNDLGPMVSERFEGGVGSSRPARNPGGRYQGRSSSTSRENLPRARNIVVDEPRRGGRAHFGCKVVLHPLAGVLVGVESRGSGVTDGHQDVDLDAEGGTFEGERTGQADEACFGHRIRRHAERPDRCTGGCQQDSTETLLAEMGPCRSAQVEGANQMGEIMVAT